MSVLEQNDDNEEAKRGSDKGYLINAGVLFRYIPDEDNEEAQLVISTADRESIIDTYHNDAAAGQYGILRTTARITQRYFWPGMRNEIAKYVRKCVKCQQYKSSNLKPAGIIQSVVSKQHFEVIAADLFGPLPETSEGYQYILIVEDVASRWVEIFPLKTATAQNCAEALINEIFMRFGTPRRIAIMEHSSCQQ